MNIEKDNTIKLDKIARRYFDKYIRFLGDAMWVKYNFSLNIGGNFIGRKQIGQVDILSNGLSIDVNKSHSLEIKKICEEIEKKENIKINLKIIN